MCAGQLLQISAYQALFSLLGTKYGGDGVNTFGLPDLRGRVPMGWTNGTVSGITTNNMGDKRGTEYTTITQTQLPSHTHSASVSGQGGLSGTITAAMNVNDSSADSGDPSGKYIGNDQLNSIYATNPATGKTLASGAITVNNGLSLNMSGLTVAIGATPAQSSVLYLFQPTQVVNYCIAYVGLYPTRD